ncbi:MAG TPA: efflux RND transporter periplasmic adaptor subunit [Pseudolabrys sp.]|jgi:multidrug efflux pump subunit AcrA (membrane-fusion protein)|nr:efflux RND transporter periplasmic adaptor subunit [Pseudolabrys sp.]
MRKVWLPLLALAGLGIGLFVVVQDDSATTVAGAPSPTAFSPFPSYVEGTGITEASTGNIAIGTPVSGIVTAIDVTWGQQVKAGAPLFAIDDRDVKAQLLPAEANVKQAESDLAKAKNLLTVGAGLAVGTSISKVALANRRYDVAIKQAALAAAKAQVERLKIEIDRHTVRAPVTGRVLQINTRVGEFAESRALNPPLMLFGDDRLLYLRVQIDEDDAWRVKPDAPAVAFLRGNPKLKARLTFVRFDPYIVPKTSFTGSSTERTDMRVLPVIYSFKRAALPVYAGQEMEAFIKAPPAAAGDAHAASGKNP